MSFWTWLGLDRDSSFNIYRGYRPGVGFALRLWDDGLVEWAKPSSKWRPIEDMPEEDRRVAMTLAWEPRLPEELRRVVRAGIKA